MYQTDSIGDIIYATKRFLECSLLIHLNKRITVDTLVDCYSDFKSYARRIAKEQQEKNLKELAQNQSMFYLYMLYIDVVLFKPSIVPSEA